MQSDGSPSKNEEKRVTSTTQPLKPLFAEREKRRIIKDFVDVYISGRVEIIFLDAAEQMELAKRKGENLSYAQAHENEIGVKTDLKDKIAICSGAKEATAEQLQMAIDGLFEDILIYRNGNRIKGVFTESSLETRVRDLEEGLEKVNNLVEQIVEWIYRGVT